MKKQLKPMLVSEKEYQEAIDAYRALPTNVTKRRLINAFNSEVARCVVEDIRKQRAKTREKYNEKNDRRKPERSQDGN